MAAIENEHLILNVVYTGPPLAGKTQSVKALVPLLKGQGSEHEVMSPGDWRGRTAFFDWAVYEGGAFEGKSIKCRIISTPGQVALSDRRELLLRAADAVILVVDSQADALERAVHCYEEMAPWIAESSRDVPVRVVLQCNKQDLPGSLSPDELSRRLPIPCGKDVFATSANTGKGLRAAFVAGVRNAVERARSLVAQGLVLEAPEIGSGEELFERMRRQVEPVGSLRPSASAPAATPSQPAPSQPAPSRPASGQPSSERGARGSTRAKAENRAESSRSTPRSSGGRGTGNAGSGSVRPAMPKDARAAGSGSLPFGGSKSKAASGLFPSLSSRSGAEQPSLPPDHPFAHDAPARQTTRRPNAGGSSRPGSAGKRSGAAPSAGGGRPKPSDRATPGSLLDDAARAARPSRPSAPSATPGTSRGTTTHATTTRARPVRDGGGAKAPAASSEGLATRSGREAATGPAPARGDTRPSLDAVATRAAADAATTRAPARTEQGRAPAAPQVVPAVDAAGSSPPSSATASAPTSSARRAIVPPHAEPRALREPTAPASPYPVGGLDPAGEPARSWRPGQGRRPAIMPASAYHALAPAESEARREVLSAAASAQAAAVEKRASTARAAASRAETKATELRHDARTIRQPQPPAPKIDVKAFAAGGPRPAIMPASAYFAALAARAEPGASPSAPANDAVAAATAPARDERALDAASLAVSPGESAATPAHDTGATARAAAASRAEAPPRAPSRERSARPAVMPAGSYLATLAARGTVQLPTHPAADGASSVETTTNAPAARVDAARAAPAGAAASPSPAAVAGARPAVMPASAWRAALEAGEEMPTRAGPSPATPSSNQPASAATIARGIGAPPALGLDDDPVDSGWPDAGEVLSMPPPQFAALRERAGTKDRRRPAVMPASAWRALVERGELPAESGFPLTRGQPEGAASVPREAAADASAAPRDSAAGDRLDAGSGGDDEWPRALDGGRSDAPGSARSLRLLRGGTGQRRGEDPRAPMPRPSLTLLERPAVMPVHAWQRTRGDRSQPALAAGPSPREGATRPAVMPASAWRAWLEAGVDTARPLPVALSNDASADRALAAPEVLGTIEALDEVSDIFDADASPRAANDGADASGADASADPSVRPQFADPAAFGLESSPLIEPISGSAEESSESFRIPETPPGLQAFVAKARLSTPPPAAPASGDDVIPSLVPSLGPQDELSAVVASGDPHDPPEFAGPRMPGHVRAPRAVWRRSTWRTLETHITSDATALEDARGRWIGELAPGWYARTLCSATDARAARRAFAEEVLRERRLGQYLSRPRCVALTEEGDRFWIWQAACRVPTLAAVLGRRLAARESPSAMAEALLDASLAFVEARQRFIRARVPLPLSLHALSVQDDKLVYSGLLPDPGAVFVHPPSDGHLAFEDALRKKWPSAHIDGGAVFAELSGKAAGRLPEPILEIIRSVAGQTSIATSTNEVSG